MTGDVLWIVDRGPARRRGWDRPELLDAIRAQGADAMVIDFERDGLPASDGIGQHPVLLRGSAGFTETAARRWPTLRPGAFYVAEAFHYARLDRLGGALLNHRARTMTLGAFRRERDCVEATLGRDGALFVRPATARKAFNGFVLAPGESIGAAHWSRFRTWSAPGDDLEIVVATPRTILGEWRCVVLEGEVVAASRYKENGASSPAPGCPDALRRFAETAAARLAMPVACFCLDVARTPEGPRVVEINGFSASGLYACDQAVIVARLTAFASRPGT